MYLEYFGLKREPFSVTSDPAFLWMGPAHEEAYAHIRYAVQQRKGFALLSGEVGTGKTTLVNKLLNSLDENHPTCVVFNPVLSLDSLLHYIFKDFGLGEAPADRGEAISALFEWLAIQGQADRTPVIVIDEAQNLPDDSLEGLRLLSNFETEQTKLLQILLVGQPELRRRLQSEHLRQINQRIAIHYHLVGLEPGKVVDYVRHRLQVAGAPRPEALFSTAALEKLGKASQGVPRVINQLADLCLLKTYSQGKLLVDEDVLQSVLDHEFADRLPADAASTVMAVATAAAPVRKRSRALGFAAAAVLALCAGLVGAWLGGVGRHGDDLRPQAAEGRPTETKFSVAATSEAPPAVDTKLSASLDSARKRILELETRLQDRTEIAGGVKSAAAAADSVFKLETVDPQGILPAPAGFSRVRIRPNDTLVKIVTREYGRGDWALVQRVLGFNPQIENPNIIRVGDIILLPDK